MGYRDFAGMGMGHGDGAMCDVRTTAARMGAVAGRLDSVVCMKPLDQVF